MPVRALLAPDLPLLVHKPKPKTSRTQNNVLSSRVGGLIPRIFIIYQHACTKVHYRILVQHMERYKYINWSLENHVCLVIDRS